HHVSALAAKADLLLGRGDPDAAAALARRAAGLEPSGEGRLRSAAKERAAALAALGRAEEARAHRVEARAAYQRALELDAYRVDALVGAGRVMLREGQPRDALGRYEAALEVVRHRSDAASVALVEEAQLGRAEALLRVARPADARAALDALAAERPQDAEVALWRGRALAELGEDERAVGELRRAIALGPDRFEAYMALAQHFFATDRPGDAAEILRSGQTKVEPSVEVHVLLGESLLRRNELPAAEEELRRALRLDSNNRAALFAVGVVERRSGRLDEAEATFDRLASFDATYPGMALERANIYEARGQSSRAVEALERALSRSPEDAELKLRFAAAQVAAGRL
ncbi:MAG: tetratricopeptide repeat protein, partial [Polyangiaceae bacterium]|nr:tetratricopeptide repeat protein [Polyangiaceae bacterium]